MGAKKPTVFERSNFILLYIFLLSFGTIAKIAYDLGLLSSFSSLSNLGGRLMVFDRYIVEFCALTTVCIVLSHLGRYMRYFTYGLMALVTTAYGVQLGAMSFGGEYLSRLAVANLVHITFFLNTMVISQVLLATTVLILVLLLIERIRVQRFNFQRILLLLLVGLIMQQSRRWTPNAIATERADILAKRNIPHSSPLLALYQLFQPIPTDINWNNFSKLDIIELSNYGFTLKKDEPYPFLKPKIYDSPLPFATPPHGESNRPNVLLIFTEGFSARSLDAYDHRYPNLTPNIAQFARSSMVVDRFYNHTAATYRGLHGQLCSLYPKKDGYDPVTKHGLPAQSYFCLTDLFNEANYTTTFINSHPKNDSFVDEMTTRLNFHETISGDQFSTAFLAGEPLKQPSALSDHQLFRGLLPALEKISASSSNGQPFFVAMYNSETHANVDVVDDGITYGNGENNALNTIHNYDRAFGLFWQEFSKSDLAKNTVVILTADHCHYSEKSFVSAFDSEDYHHIFVDRVPLIIHDPRTSLPPRFDAMNSTSIDLAPSLAHYLQLKNGPNPFFGRSIFEKNRDSFNKVGISGYGNNTYLIDDETISFREKPNQHTASLQILAKYLHFSTEMESADRIWDPALRR